MSTIAAGDVSRAADLAEPARGAVRDLILVLADSKRLLGMRYANWILGAPELEAGIACASMAQDEWGHGRLLYALLREFGDDVDALEHGRQPADYCSIEVLDREPESWPMLAVINALVDGALSLQLEALGAATYLPLRQRVQKLLEEERFHAAHGAAWLRRLASSSDESRTVTRAAVADVLPVVMRWFGPDSGRARTLHTSGITSDVGSGMRVRFIERMAPLLRPLGDVDSLFAVQPDFDGFDEAARRTSGTAPDERTIAQVRGDLNRAFLMD